MEIELDLQKFRHEHPLTFIDLESEHQNEDEEEDEEDDEDDKDDLITTTQYLRLYCDRCGGEIYSLNQGYYKCSESCDYLLHKLCAELPTTLIHTSHLAHGLILQQRNIGWRCNICRSHHKPDDLRYRCSQCDFDVDLICAVAMEEKRIPLNHPCHPHPLILVTVKEILCECDACGRKHEGNFYHCITCISYSIHHDCATLPRKLLVQRATNDRFTHPHQLTLSYSFHHELFIVKCRICDKRFFEQLWLYECQKCRYYAHVDCATSRTEPFMSIFLAPGLGRIHKNYEDVDHPNLLHLPFLDESCNLVQHRFSKEMSHGLIDHEVKLEHHSHQHPLIMFDTEINGVAKPSSSSIKSLALHNPMKKIQILCNGCVRPITTVPFYKCPEEDENCNFVLHEWCTRLPTQVPNHPCHQEHILVLMPKVRREFFGVFRCKICRLFCNGFAYGCDKCDYYIDVNCAFMPDKVTHQAHKNHLLLRRMTSYGRKRRCRACLFGINENNISFTCDSCDFDLHPECALLLPGTIRHKYDKHPMNLSYLAIENHKSEYFCEICEREFFPAKWFYHCSKCVQPQSMHSACAPLILRSEQHVYSIFKKCIYEYMNIKFGGILNIEDHSHPLLFVQGIKSDGDCAKCSNFWTLKLKYFLIFKCLQCKFALHFNCAKMLSN